MTARLLTEAEVAEILGYAPYTLRRRRSDGNPILEPVRVGDSKRPRIRYRQVDVDRYIDSRRGSS